MVASGDRRILFKLGVEADPQAQQVLNSFAAQAQATQQRINAAMRQNTGGGVGGLSAKQVEQAEKFQAKLEEQNAKTMAKLEAQFAKEAEREQAIEDEKLAKLIAKEEKYHADLRRQQERTLAQQEKDNERYWAGEARKIDRALAQAESAQARLRSSQEAVAGAVRAGLSGVMQMGRGLATMGLVGEEDTKKILDGLLKIQSAFDVVSGAIGIWQQMSVAARQYETVLKAVAATEEATATARALGGAANAGGAAGAAGRAAGMSSLGSAASSVATKLGAIAAPAATVVLGLGALGAALHSYGGGSAERKSTTTDPLGLGPQEQSWGEFFASIEIGFARVGNKIETLTGGEVKPREQKVTRNEYGIGQSDSGYDFDPFVNAALALVETERMLQKGTAYREHNKRYIEEQTRVRKEESAKAEVGFSAREQNARMEADIRLITGHGTEQEANSVQSKMLAELAKIAEERSALATSQYQATLGEGGRVLGVGSKEEQLQLAEKASALERDAQAARIEQLKFEQGLQKQVAEQALSGLREQLSLQKQVLEAAREAAKAAMEKERGLQQDIGSLDPRTQRRVFEIAAKINEGKDITQDEKKLVYNHLDKQSKDLLDAREQAKGRRAMEAFNAEQERQGKEYRFGVREETERIDARHKAGKEVINRGRLEQDIKSAETALYGKPVEAKPIKVDASYQHELTIKIEGALELKEKLDEQLKEASDKIQQNFKDSASDIANQVTQQIGRQFEETQRMASRQLRTSNMLREQGLV